MSAFAVRVRNVHGQVSAIGSSGGHTVVIDRPTEAGGGGLGFNGGQLLYLAVAGCISNDLFREAAKRGIRLDRVLVEVDGDFVGEPSVSTEIVYRVRVTGDASREALDDLVSFVDGIAEIPNSLRRGTKVTRAAPED